MTLNEFYAQLKDVCPDALRADKDALGIEIILTDGYCQVMYHLTIIGANDATDEGGWDRALELAIERLKAWPKI